MILKNNLEIGKNYFIRMLNYHYVGELKEFESNCILLTKASWVADDGRYSECLSEGKICESEIMPNDVILFTNNMVDITRWDNKLPKNNIPYNKSDDN